jgi:SAM-dependent methyltransferase
MPFAVENKAYFKTIQREYGEASASSSQMYLDIGRRLDEILFGTVIDFGNGGVINYDAGRLDSLICVDLIDPGRSTFPVSGEKIRYVQGDFYDIGVNFRPDCVLAQFLLHHLTDDQRLLLSLKRVRTLLRPGGKLILLEIKLPDCFEVIQRLFRPTLAFLYTLLQKPPVRFFSLRGLFKLLMEAGFAPGPAQVISIRGRVSPAPVFFPQLRMPGWLYPFRCMLIEARPKK